MNVYATNNPHSRVICHAFAEGNEGKIVPPVKLLDGPAMVYGILRGCGEIMKECWWVGRDCYYVDHGYFKRGYYDGYFRVVKNGLQSTGVFPYPYVSDERWRALDVPMRPWKRTGKHIVVCPISSYLGNFLGIDPEKWTAAVVREIALHTERPITVKPKNGEPLQAALKDAWCLVTHSSNAAVDAIVNGTPAIALGASSITPVGWKLKDIENPSWPEREEWAWCLADNQFTLDEFRAGLDLDSLS